MLDRIDMYAGELSKGLKQRLALARTLIHEPKILFFDEPTAGLDPIAAVKVRELIIKLKSRNRTIFINSHNLEEVQKVCDRVGIIDKGRIKRIGTSDEISKNLWEFRILEIKLKKLSDEIISQLSKLDFIKEIFPINGSIRIHLKDLEEFTPIIVEKVVKLGGKIISVEPIEYSLEDIYVKLMEDSKINQQSGEK
ncbi:Vitamin B12 import ATP-binding protein BtuD [subsurface metagenome]